MAVFFPGARQHRLHVTHIITGLPRGGAQTVLAYLVRSCDSDRFTMSVVSLTELGAVGEQLVNDSIPVRALGLDRRRPSPVRLARLIAWLRRDRPALVQTWLYHGDLLGGIAARIAGIPVLWNIRQTDLQPATTRRSTVWTARACARVSGLVPSRIVCCSEATLRVHCNMGYDRARMVVVPNGVDLMRFRPNASRRATLREACGIAADAPVIGSVARFHPQKDHRTLVQAAAELLRRRPNVHFVLCGEKVDAANDELAGWIDAQGLREHFHLLGLRDDVPTLTAGFDVATSTSSYGEGFNNVLAEAMACGVPCVTTDVGDAAAIVGSTGWVVPPADPRALAHAWDVALSSSPLAGVAARARAEQEFSLAARIDRYQDIYVAEARRAAGGNSK